MNYDDKLKELKINLPEAKAPVGNYVATKISGKMLFISGQISIDENGQLIKGKVGKDLDTESGYNAAKRCALSMNKKLVRVMKGQFGPYIKYKSLNATIPEEKDPTELTMEEALILIEKRKEYDKTKKKKKK